MTHVPWRMQTKIGKGLRPVDRYKIYTDIDLSTTDNFQLHSI